MRQDTVGGPRTLSEPDAEVWRAGFNTWRDVVPFLQNHRQRVWKRNTSSIYDHNGTERVHYFISGLAFDNQLVEFNLRFSRLVPVPSRARLFARHPPVAIPHYTFPFPFPFPFTSPRLTFTLTPPCPRSIYGLRYAHS